MVIRSGSNNVSKFYKCTLYFNILIYFEIYFNLLIIIYSVVIVYDSMYACKLDYSPV